MSTPPALPRWTPQDEALAHITKALLLLIQEGDYDLVRELGKVAHRTQGHIAHNREGNPFPKSTISK